VFLALGIEHAIRMRHVTDYLLCPLCLNSIFPRYPQMARLSKTVMESKMFV